MTTATTNRTSAITSFVVASRYMPVYIALLLLVVVALIWVPATLGSVTLSAVAPYGALLAITALGQMLVIMTGGIDLSVPGTMSLAAALMVGVGQQSDERIAIAMVTALGAAALIGLLNGILIGGLKLNALIVTLAVGQVVIGVVDRYGRASPVQSPVPLGWSEWTSTKIFGISPVFWIGAILTIVLIFGFRYTTLGRRFQVVGANPVASQVVGVRITLNQILRRRRGGDLVWGRRSLPCRGSEHPRSRRRHAIPLGRSPPWSSVVPPSPVAWPALCPLSSLRSFSPDSIS